ncbi:MAG: 4Fe-4S binding protein [Candidatus Pacebacteria bacterium]|jgi:ferredoxin|nr:4Fe-4S binding protein [Candidatus Paceibacterota bacterium]
MPKINKDQCVGCGACITECPNQAIEIKEDGKAEINQEKCQKCGKCIEVCSVGAIEKTEE